MTLEPKPVEHLFETVERESTLATRVTDQIERLIVDGQLKLGDRLSTERELAAQFGVSRTVIREATRILNAKGLLRIDTGSGFVVSRPSAKIVAQSMSLFLRGGEAQLDYNKVHQVRRLLEIEIAGLAAENRTFRDMAIMEENLQAYSSSVEEVQEETFVRQDVAFHSALAYATQNELFPLLLDSLADIMREVRLLGFSVAEMRSLALKRHYEIFQHVKAGDAAAARLAMEQHLIESEETMRRALTRHRAQNDEA